MIVVTGDIHGDITRFQHPALKKLRRGDFLIVCGDFGFLWDGSGEEKKAIRKLSRLKYTVLFVDGAHENFDMLEKAESQDWKGGRVSVIRPNVLYLHRGQIFELEGKTFFTMGGGDDIEAEPTEEQKSMPTTEELEEAYHRLERRDFQVDYIITHDCSTKVKQFLDLNAQEGSVPINYLNTFFEKLYEKTPFKRWFFGAYHMDKNIPPRCSAVYRDVLPVEK